MFRNLYQIMTDSDEQKVGRYFKEKEQKIGKEILFTEGSRVRFIAKLNPDLTLSRKAREKLYEDLEGWEIEDEIFDMSTGNFLDQGKFIFVVKIHKTNKNEKEIENGKE